LDQDDIERIAHSIRENSMGLSTLAKWILGVTGGVLTVVFTGQSITLSGMKTDVALLQRDVTNLTKAIESRMGDSFTTGDASAMSELFELRIAALVEADLRLQDRVKALEDRTENE